MFNLAFSSKKQLAFMYSLFFGNGIAICVWLFLLNWLINDVSFVYCSADIPVGAAVDDLSNLNCEIIEEKNKSNVSSLNLFLGIGAGIVVIGLLIYFSDSYFPSSPSYSSAYDFDINGSYSRAIVRILCGEDISVGDSSTSESSTGGSSTSGSSTGESPTGFDSQFLSTHERAELVMGFLNYLAENPDQIV